MDGTGGKEIFKCPRMIIHPQFHPSDPELIEYAQDPAPCMWPIKLDGFDNTWLHRHDNDEFIVHETFLVGSGEDLIFIVWSYALKRMRLASREVFYDCRIQRLAYRRQRVRRRCSLRYGPSRPRSHSGRRGHWQTPHPMLPEKFLRRQPVMERALCRGQGLGRSVEREIQIPQLDGNEGGHRLWSAMVTPTPLLQPK